MDTFLGFSPFFFLFFFSFIFISWGLISPSLSLAIPWRAVSRKLYVLWKQNGLILLHMKKTFSFCIDWKKCLVHRIPQYSDQNFPFFHMIVGSVAFQHSAKCPERCQMSLRMRKVVKIDLTTLFPCYFVLKRSTCISEETGRLEGAKCQFSFSL